MVQRCRVAVWRSWGSACCRRSANIGLSKRWSSSQTGHDYEDEQSHGRILTRRNWAKAPMQQAGQRGTEKAGHMRRANKFHATQKHQRMRRPCCQGSESAYPFQSDAAKTTKPKASADTSSTLPEFEMWRSTGTCPPSLGSGCSTPQLRASAIMSRVTHLRFFEKPTAIASAMRGSSSATRLEAPTRRSFSTRK